MNYCPAHLRIIVQNSCIFGQNSAQSSSMTGGTVYNAPLIGGLQSMDIPLAGIPGGLYFCVLVQGERVLETQKLLIIR
jgi:hypothetical protein